MMVDVNITAINQNESYKNVGNYLVPTNSDGLLMHR